MSVIPDSAQALSKRDAWSVQRHWLEAFAKDSAGSQAKVAGGFMWHLFSFGQCRHLHGPRARHAYEQQPVVPYYLFSEGMIDCVSVESDRFPSLTGAGDWYVVAQDFSWTYVSTHEQTEYFAERML